MQLITSFVVSSSYSIQVHNLYNNIRSYYYNALAVCMTLWLLSLRSTQSLTSLSNRFNTIIPHSLAMFSQYCGLCLKRTTFRLFSSAVGSPGRLLLPSWGHYFMIISPNTASLASFINRVGSLAPFKLGHRAITSLISPRDSCIAPDGEQMAVPSHWLSVVM